MGADLSHIDTWLFDLDNTLYPLETGLAFDISDRITTYVEQLTGLPRDDARALQKRYLEEHGLTLRGLMLHHGVDPDEYHAHLADVSLEFLARDAALIEALERLPGRRLIFTNADAGHAARVMRRLGVEALFDDVFHIAAADFVPKPSPRTFERLAAAHAIEAIRTCFFEDAPANLAPAHALGMTTVLVGAKDQVERPGFIDYVAPDLAAFLAAASLKDPS